MTQLPATLPPWSYSMLEAFEQCPRKAYHRYILKEKGPETAEQFKGNTFDKAVEARIRDGVALPEEHRQYEPLAASIAELAKADVQVYTQMKIGIGRDFQVRSFFAPDVWGRGVLDVALVSRRKIIPGQVSEPNRAVIADWKTGKNNEGKAWSNNGLQLKIFTLLLFKFFPGVEKVTAFNIWLKSNEFGKPYVFTRENQAQLWREVLLRIMAMEKAFAPGAVPIETPGPLCQYCPVKICQYNRS